MKRPLVEIDVWGDYVHCSLTRAVPLSAMRANMYEDIGMPLTKKGRKIKAAMTREYGAKKGTSVFYASRNKGTISGVDRTRKSGRKKG